MNQYHKINSIFKRDMVKNSPNYGNFIEGLWSLPEFEYLKDNQWIWTEKIDGTNIRICYYSHPLLPDKYRLEFKGKTDKAQMPNHLLIRLEELFSVKKLESIFGVGEELSDVCLYGEGYGAKIQKAGGNYIRDGVDFILFDIKIGDTWLKREDIEKIADQLGIKVVPIIGCGTIEEGIKLIKSKTLKSKIAQTEMLAEGLILKPEIELKDRRGHRIITKIKYSDF